MIGREVNVEKSQLEQRQSEDQTGRCGRSGEAKSGMIQTKKGRIRKGQGKKKKKKWAEKNKKTNEHGTWEPQRTSSELRASGWVQILGLLPPADN